MIVLKLYTNPRYVFETMHNVVMLATARVWLSMHRERLQQLVERLEQVRR